LIYSSLDDTKIQWTVDDLRYLRANKTFFKSDKSQEVYGVFYETQEEDYYALISASDNFGKRKLTYLFYVLLVSYIIFTIASWLITYAVVKKLLVPIDTFHKQLISINENNLDTRIAVKQNKDEIDLLADEFNQMLERISTSYKKQKEFTANASHELRTPIARITAQLENKIIAERKVDGSATFNENLLQDINQLSELTSSLLLLSKLDSDLQESAEKCRIDELLFDAAEIINRQFGDFKLDLDFLEVDQLEVIGNKSLLSISFSNLLKNAYLYSDNRQCKVSIESNKNELIVLFSNKGQTISESEQKNLFEPFMRGQNSKSKAGLGLGLRMVQRILKQHQASIVYSESSNGSNEFEVRFKMNKS
jgi:two-component system, OmpR family, sensor histidine kinase ArlS